MTFVPAANPLVYTDEIISLRSALTFCATRVLSAKKRLVVSARLGDAAEHLLHRRRIAGMRNLWLGKRLP